MTDLTKLKPGDRVRITVEAEVKEFEGNVYTVSLYGVKCFAHPNGAASVLAEAWNFELSRKLQSPIDYRLCTSDGPRSGESQ